MREWNKWWKKDLCELIVFGIIIVGMNLIDLIWQNKFFTHILIGIVASLLVDKIFYFVERRWEK